MKRFTPVLLAGILALAACSDRAPTAVTGRDAASIRREAHATPGQDFVAGQIIVRFTPGANRSEVAEAHRAHKKDDMALARTEILEVPVGEEMEIAAQMARNPNVEFAEPDWIQKVGPCEVASACTLPDGQFFVYKWDLHNTGTIVDQVLGYGAVSSGTAGADTKWAETYDYLGANFQGSAVIAILDTGIRTTHQAFTGKILKGQRFVVDGQPATNYTDDNGHGSHVAGIAAGLGTAAVPGMAYGANIKLLIGKVCNAAGSCPSSATANAIVWAADNGANVINMSLGSFGGNPDGTGSAAQQAALQYAASKNVLPVCATGNDDGKPEYSGGVGYPARFDECMAVAATNWNDGKASYSNYGPQTEISAPGGDGNPAGNPFSLILAPNYTSNTGYAWKAGTSMATPQVAGLAALLWATGLHDANAIRARIKATADDLGAPGMDPYFGAGRINVYRAITGNSTKAPPVVNPGGVYTGAKGVAIQFDGSASYDPNGKAVTFSWSFGDGGTSTQVKPTHAYLRAGTYTVTLAVRDASGLVTTAVTQAIIPNAVPVVSVFAGATILRGETYAAAGSFSDPDPDTWTATVDYGDGGGAQALALSATGAFSLTHTYGAAGVFTATVAVSDNDGGTGTRGAQVTVWSPQQGIQALAQQVSALGLNNPPLNPLTNAVASLDRGSTGAAANQLEAFINQVQALVNSRRLTTAQGDDLTAFANRILRSINA